MLHLLLRIADILLQVYHILFYLSKLLIDRILGSDVLILGKVSPGNVLGEGNLTFIGRELTYDYL